MFETEYKKEPYMCNKCKTFHNPITKGKRNITHLEHFCYFSKYRADFDQAELFKLSFKKSWKREAKKH